MAGYIDVENSLIAVMEASSKCLETTKIAQVMVN